MKLTQKKSLTPNEPMLLHASLVFQKKFMTSVNHKVLMAGSKELKFLFELNL